MQCKCKCKYNISIVSSVSVRPVNKIAFEKKEWSAIFAFDVWCAAREDDLCES